MIANCVITLLFPLVLTDVVMFSMINADSIVVCRSLAMNGTWACAEFFNIKAITHEMNKANVILVIW